MMIFLSLGQKVDCLNEHNECLLLTKLTTIQCEYLVAFHFRNLHCYELYLASLVCCVLCVCVKRNL